MVSTSTDTMYRTAAFLATLCGGFVITGALLRPEIPAPGASPAPAPPSAEAAIPAPTPPAPPAPPSAEAVINEHESDIRTTCEVLLKEQLRNPDSYRSASIQMIPADPNKSGVVVSTVVQFRAENGFGGMSPGTAICGHDANGRPVVRPYITGQN